MPCAFVFSQQPIYFCFINDTVTIAFLSIFTYLEGQECYLPTIRGVGKRFFTFVIRVTFLNVFFNIFLIFTHFFYHSNGIKNPHCHWAQIFQFYSPGGATALYNTEFLGLIKWIKTSSEILVDSADFARVIVVTNSQMDRQTDHATRDICSNSQLDERSSREASHKD